MIEIQKHQPWMLRLSKQNCSKVKEKLENINQIVLSQLPLFAGCLLVGLLFKLCMQQGNLRSQACFDMLIIN